MRVIQGGRTNIFAPDEEKLKKRRRALLAMVHIAKKELALNEGEYEMILHSFKVDSASELSIATLEKMVKYLKHLGWKPRRKKKSPEESGKLDALRRRCVALAQLIPNGERRLAGLAKSICGVSSLTWCREDNKLERLLAILEDIKRKEVGIIKHKIT